MATHNFSETETSILAAALEEFSMYGRKGARMQGIADRAGLNKALLHYYFRSKDRLYEEVFTYVFHRYIQRMGVELRAEGDFASVLRGVIHRYIEILSENPALPMFMLREIAEGAPVFSRRLADLAHGEPGNMPNALLDFFEHGTRSGAIRAVDPVQTVISIIGTCVFFFAGFPVFASLFPEMRPRRNQMLEERKDHIFDLVYYGLKPRTE
jgi:TetR/AcrR family transcriptional regulator